MKVFAWILVAAVSLYSDVFLFGGPLFSSLAALIGVTIFIWLAIKRKSIPQALAVTKLLPAFVILPFACLGFGALLNRQIENKVIAIGGALEAAYRADNKWPNSLDSVKSLSGQLRNQRIWIGTYWIAYSSPETEYSKALLYFKKYGDVRQAYQIAEHRFEEERPD